MNKGWEGMLLSDGQRIVYPVNDIKGHHITSQECWCTPFIDDNGENQILVHQAADKREKH